MHIVIKESMAEELDISSRSYIEQEHGKYGFSSMTLIYFLHILQKVSGYPLERKPSSSQFLSILSTYLVNAHTMNGKTSEF